MVFALYHGTYSCLYTCLDHKVIKFDPSHEHHKKSVYICLKVVCKIKKEQEQVMYMSGLLAPVTYVII